ncbi:MAG: hypothetical protein QOD58_1006, partial [Mycobacterium sp.]|nr:hypothetical protein [Mycobacterium sp.]
SQGDYLMLESGQMLSLCMPMQ